MFYEQVGQANEVATDSAVLSVGLALERDPPIPGAPEKDPRSENHFPWLPSEPRLAIELDGGVYLQNNRCAKMPPQKIIYAPSAFDGCGFQI